MIYNFGLSVVAHDYVPRPWEVEDGGSGFEYQTQIHIKFDTRLSKMYNNICMIYNFLH